MKMSEILRNLADKLASIENSQNDPQTNKSIGGTPVEPVKPTLDNEPVMVPPLQMKLELLKKASDVDSHYDDERPAPDELDQVKKNAGLTAVIQHEAGEDNDILG
jgi:hypothetical protein